jgi:hypothetical protein
MLHIDSSGSPVFQIIKMSRPLTYEQFLQTLPSKVSKQSRWGKIPRFYTVRSKDLSVFADVPAMCESLFEAIEALGKSMSQSISVSIKTSLDQVYAENRAVLEMTSDRSLSMDDWVKLYPVMDSYGWILRM